MSNYMGNWGHAVGQFLDSFDGRLQDVERFVRSAVSGSAAATGGSTNAPSAACPSFGTESGGRSRSSNMENGGPSAFGENKPSCSALPAAGAASTKFCDDCHFKFSLFHRKKTCTECHETFCVDCFGASSASAPSSQKSVCSRCRILLRRPMTRADLMSLRVKDLQKHLVRKQIDTKSCVEKKDLVELVLLESGQEPRRCQSASMSPLSSRAPIERQTNFPQDYVSSSHRRRSQWLDQLDDEQQQQQQSGPAADRDPVLVFQQDDDDDADAVGSSPDKARTSPATERTLVEDLESAATEAQLDSGQPVGPEAVSEQNEMATSSSSAAAEGCLGCSGAASGLAAKDVTPPSSSPSNRFSRQGLVRLEEIESLEDLHQLSAKQCKDLLAMSRVNFHGVLEKEELVKIVERLWRQEQKAREEKGNLDDQDLCKVCWDNVVDCVMLECGHMATCTKCGKQLAECPICRQYVVRVVRTFKA